MPCRRLVAAYPPAPLKHLPVQFVDRPQCARRGAASCAPVTMSLSTPVRGDDVPATVRGEEATTVAGIASER